MGHRTGLWDGDGREQGACGCGRGLSFIIIEDRIWMGRELGFLFDLAGVLDRLG